MLSRPVPMVCPIVLFRMCPIRGLDAEALLNTPNIVLLND